MPRYQLFVDDSGNREYAEDRKYGLVGKSLHFVYGSILIQQDEAAKLTERLKELKQLVFGTADVEVKSNWIRQPKERRIRYCEPFGLTDQDLDQFTDDYYRLLNQTSLELIGAVVNKLHMQETYSAPPGPWYAPTAAYDVLLQRAVQAVPPGATLAVTIDNISGKTPHQNEYRELLRKHHASLKAEGSRLQRQIPFACLETPPRFVFSEHSDLIQAADLVSYNVHRQFRDHGDDWEKAPGPDGKLPVYEPLNLLIKKFRLGPRGRVQGFGIVKMPKGTSRHWVVSDK